MLQVENLVVKYRNIAAVKGISLDVAEGEIISVVGANGAGKSTTVNTIAGIVKMTSGKIIYNGIDISKTTPQERVKQGIILAPEGRQAPETKKTPNQLQTSAPSTESTAVQNDVKLKKAVISKVKAKKKGKACRAYLQNRFMGIQFRLTGGDEKCR